MAFYTALIRSIYYVRLWHHHLYIAIIMAIGNPYHKIIARLSQSIRIAWLCNWGLSYHYAGILLIQGAGGAVHWGV